MMKVSVIIRTYNEQRHLGELLQGIANQELRGLEGIEVVVVDSGSTDRTLEIASEYNARIVSIKKEEFSFGRSLNIGCDAATGDALVFVSGHCIPVNSAWIADLVSPLGQADIVYAYGGQLGNEDSHFSEKQIFAKYFPAENKIPQEGFYCNNANAALLKDVWAACNFDEELTGLEDMYLAKQLVARGYKLAYVASAAVYHLHNESWAQVSRRFEREAIALQHIMPEVNLNRRDISRYFLSAVLLDIGAALQQRCLRHNIKKILQYRYMQFSGAYRGNHFTRKLSRDLKESYFYPR
jgi:rhamnosyltransferase